MAAAHLRRDRITEYLKDLDHQLSDLERLPAPSADYLADEVNFERTKAIKLTLACAIQDVARISLHIATALGLGSVRSSESETIKALSGANVITEELADKIKGIPAFRNRLIHDYLPSEFDALRLYENLRKLGEFHDFAAQIIKWLDNNVDR